MPYTPYYDGGWKNTASGGTPITASALNHMEQGISQASGLGLFEVNIPESAWNDSAPYQATVAVAGITSNFVPAIPLIIPYDGTDNDADANEAQQNALWCINEIRSSTDSLTFVAYRKKPDYTNIGMDGLKLMICEVK